MIIQTVLTDEEKDALLLALGMATGHFLRIPELQEVGKNCVRVTNKLFANSPDYAPYDEEALAKMQPRQIVRLQ